MNATPRSLRLHVGVFGRANVGKSSFVNLVAGQGVSIVSPVPGTTTDVVEKSLELLPLGPVTLLDTAGVDDGSALGAQRVERARAALGRTDVAVLVTEAGVWSAYETDLVTACERQKTPFLIVVNKVDIVAPDRVWLDTLPPVPTLELSCAAASGDARAREAFMGAFKRHLLDLAPDGFLDPPTILGDLLPSGRGLPLVVLVVPIDLQAPKGRLILPQVQAIRDALDSDAATVVVKEREYAAALARLDAPPDLVVCDSQAVLKAVADTPPAIPLTTFSILFSRYKGDVNRMAAGAARIESLRPGDAVLVAEACSHHALEDDIGRVKIPRWLRQYTGADLRVDHCAGRDFPADLGAYSLVIHCGGCSLTRREQLRRVELARAAGVPITNYGMAISVLQGVAERALSPFPAALDAYRRALADRPAAASACSAATEEGRP